MPSSAETGPCVRLSPPVTEVRVNGQVEPRVCLERLETLLGAAPRAWFSAGLGFGPASPQDVRLEQMAARIQPGSLVIAVLAGGGVLPGETQDARLLFEGHIVRIGMDLESGGEQLRFEAEDLAGDVLKSPVGGQRIRTATGTPDMVGGLSLVFNPAGRPNASGDPYEPESGGSYTIFAPTDSDDAVPWTLDAAVTYLLAEYAAGEPLAVPSAAEVTAAVGSLAIQDVRLEGRTLAEALSALLELASARLLVLAEPGESGMTRRLGIWTPARADAVWLSHQTVGAAFSPEATDFSDLAADLHFELAPRYYVAVGDRKVHESTFALIAGWDDSLATYDPDDFSPSANPDFATIRDVFRKWVLNEDGRYSRSPYGREDSPDLSAIFEDESYVRRPRRFLECLSRDALGRSLGVYAEVSLDGGTSWQRLAITARVLPGECGLYLTDDPLPPRYLAAVMRGQVRMRVTASIESDSRLRAEHADAEAEELPGRTRHILAPGGYRYRRVAPSSRFYGSGDADEVDDGARLQDLVDAAFEADRHVRAPARIHVPWLALGYRVGQRLQGVRGRQLDLARQLPGYVSDPVIHTARYVFAPAPKTELELQ